MLVAEGKGGCEFLFGDVLGKRAGRRLDFLGGESPEVKLDAIHLSSQVAGSQRGRVAQTDYQPGLSGWESDRSAGSDGASVGLAVPKSTHRSIGRKDKRYEYELSLILI